jgi:uncharacterized membrane protein YkvI
MQFEKIEDMCLISEKFETFQNLPYIFITTTLAVLVIFASNFGMILLGKNIFTDFS